MTLVGSAARVAGQLRAMREAGALRVALFPAGTERRRTLERFVQEVLPGLG